MSESLVQFDHRPPAHAVPPTDPPDPSVGRAPDRWETLTLGFIPRTNAVGVSSLLTALAQYAQHHGLPELGVDPDEYRPLGHAGRLRLWAARHRGVLVVEAFVRTMAGLGVFKDDRYATVYGILKRIPEAERVSPGTYRFGGNEPPPPTPRTTRGPGTAAKTREEETR